jgi:Beta-1,3-glucanase
VHHQPRSPAYRPGRRGVQGKARIAQANADKTAPASYYAQFWQLNAINGKRYGFLYDDDADQSSDISVSRPRYMIVAVGW